MMNQNIQNGHDKQDQQDPTSQQIDDPQNKNITIIQQQSQQLQHKQNKQIDLNKYDEVRVIKIKEQDLQINQFQNNHRSSQKNQSKKSDSHNQIQKNTQLANQQSDAKMQNIHRAYPAQYQKKTDNAYCVDDFNRQVQYQQFITNLNNSESDDNGQEGGVVNNVIQIQNNNDRQNNSKQNNNKQNDNEQNNSKYRIKKNIIRSLKYLSEVFKIMHINFIVTFILIIVILIIQNSFKADQNCNLDELAKFKKDRNGGLQCPLDSYLMMNMVNVASFLMFQMIYFLLFTNLYQFACRKIIQYVYFTILVAFLSYKYIDYTLGESSHISMYIILLLVTFIIQGIISKHNLDLLFYRFFQILFYMLVISAVGAANTAIRDRRNFYAIMLFQYITLLGKKVSQIYLKQKLINNLYYDDIAVAYIANIIIEYIFVFDYVLIQNNASSKQLVMIFNFIVIQTQNITNINIFYEFYSYFSRKGTNMCRDMIAIKYFLVVGILVIHAIEHVVSNLHIMIVIGVVSRFIQRIMNRDNILAIIRSLNAARSNGYFEQKINEKEINDFTIQQSILGFFIFLLYQILLIIAKVVFLENDSKLAYYQFIHQIQKKPDNNLSISNLILFDLFVILLIFVLVIIRSNKGLKVVRQPTQYQIRAIQFVTMIGYISIFNKGLFGSVYNRLKYTI